MYPKILNISYNDKITNDGIVSFCSAFTAELRSRKAKHMDLTELAIIGNNGVDDNGIKHMNLHTLCVQFNKKITDTGMVV